MENTPVYCEGWFLAKKRSVGILGEKKARQLHQDGKFYTVLLLGTDERPYCFIELRLEVGFVGVYFLDEEMRVYLQYLFTKQQNGKLFLDEVLFRVFELDTDKVVMSENYRFQPNGSVNIVEFDVRTGEKVNKDSSAPVSVSNNWEDVPSFGNYTSIARIDRHLDVKTK